MVALAGGPGQAALGLGEFIAKAIGPALGSRDLIVFDQRGTGESSPLSCPALARLRAKPNTPSSIGELIGRCAQQLGPARARLHDARNRWQTSRRCAQAGGYEKLVLYGTSYGTKVALEYAERYPQHVEALVLDSVVPAERPGTVRARHLPGDRAARWANCARTAPAPGSPPTRSATSRA